MKPAHPALVSGIRPGSPAEAAGIEPGDQVLEVDGHAPRDAIDVQFYGAGEFVPVLIRRHDGTQDLIEFEKDFDQDLGFEFEEATWDGIELCNNNCFFCFLKGLPRGMRKSLYIKDDDYRLSFLHGNFVTLTNLRESDWERLAEQRLSPLNVSVHATELDLRRSMLANAAAPDVLQQLRRLGDLGIQAHTQIVLCPEVNDGCHLDRSLDDLAGLYPAVQTISVVPVGASPLLEERAMAKEGIELGLATPAYARGVVDSVTRVQRRCRRLHGRAVAQCADEFYLAAGVKVPGAAIYDGFPQYENGIGMVRKHLDGWHAVRRQLRRRPLEPRFRAVAIGTGTLAAPVVAGVGKEFSALTGVDIEVRGVQNSVFGARVNVSGLVCGEDWIRSLTGCRAELIVLPRHSLDYFGEKFLDGITPSELSLALGRPVAYASQWSEVAAAIRGELPHPGMNRATNGLMWSR